MKPIFLSLLVMGALTSFAQLNGRPDSTRKILLVDAACGQCQLGLPGKNCDLAVRLDGKAYFVDGTSIDSHGDAHAPDGFCNSIRKANVQGELVNGRFRATYFRLVKREEKHRE